MFLSFIKVAVFAFNKNKDEAYRILGLVEVVLAGIMAGGYFWVVI